MTTFNNFRITTYNAEDGEPGDMCGVLDLVSIDEAMVAFLERVENAPAISHYLDVIDPTIQTEDRNEDVTHVLGAHHAGMTRLLGTRVHIDFTASHGMIEVSR